MPIYEYTCAACGYSFEVLMGSSDRSPDKCPKCGADDVQRLMSAHSVGRGKPEAACSGCDSGPSCESGGCGPGGCPFA